MTELLPIDPQTRLLPAPLSGADALVAQRFELVRWAILRRSVHDLGVFIGQANGCAHHPQLRQRWLRARLRQVAIYVVVTEFGVMQAAVARLLDVSRFCVLKSCRTMEDLRDDPEFDEALERLGALVRAANNAANSMDGT